jgi:hypothetical protein
MKQVLRTYFVGSGKHITYLGQFVSFKDAVAYADAWYDKFTLTSIPVVKSRRSI